MTPEKLAAMKAEVRKEARAQPPTDTTAASNPARDYVAEWERKAQPAPKLTSQQRARIILEWRIGCLSMTQIADLVGATKGQVAGTVFRANRASAA